MHRERVGRREFLRLGGAGVLALGAARGRSGSAGMTGLYVGSYTSAGGRGIYRFRLGDAALEPAGLAAAAEEPSFLALHPARPLLYAVSELPEAAGGGGRVAAFAVEAGGGLRPLGSQPSEGGAPCHLTVDASGRFVLVANYQSGSVAVLPIAPDGSLRPASDVARHAGSGPVADRQEGPHAHCVALDPRNRFAAVADLGIDRLVSYRFDAGGGTLERVGETALAPGAGPRHLAFHPSGRWAFVANELDSTLTALAFDPDRGRLEPLQSLPTAPADFHGENYPAELQPSADGRFVYLSNRGHDSLAVFAFTPGGAPLRRVQLAPSGGAWPRHFALHPAGGVLVAAHQRSDSLVAHRVDPASGRLGGDVARAAVPAPVCVLFAGT